MKAIQALSNITGFYVLTPNGQLGCFDDHKKFIVDVKLSAAFAQHNIAFLKGYLGDPQAAGYRLAVIYRSVEKALWGAETLALEEAVLRDLYPISGPVTPELTTFQKKNRFMSVYRGIELLLEYRTENMPSAPVYCPVLFDRHTNLAQYALPLTNGFAADAFEVVEVLNLLAPVPMNRREIPSVLELMTKVHEVVVKKDMREGRFTLIDDIERRTPEPIPGAGFFDVDKRAERAVIVPTADALTRHSHVLNELHTADRFEQVERWREGEGRTVDPLALRVFAQFQELSTEWLEFVTAGNPVYRAPAGARLLNRGMADPWNLYLIEGQVSLEAADGGVEWVEGGTPKARSPISFLKPRKYTVTAVTSVVFLWLHDALLEVLRGKESTSQSFQPATKPSLKHRQ